MLQIRKKDTFVAKFWPRRPNSNFPRRPSSAQARRPSSFQNRGLLDGDVCKKNTFKQFVNDLHSKKIQFDIHLHPQVYFLKKNGVIYTKLIRLENMNEAFKKIFNKDIDLPLINKSEPQPNKNIPINE